MDVQLGLGVAAAEHYYDQKNKNFNIYIISMLSFIAIQASKFCWRAI